MPNFNGSGNVSGPGNLLNSANFKEKIVAVNITQSYDDNVSMIQKRPWSTLMQCAQRAWPLNESQKAKIQQALDNGDPVYVLAYRTDKSSGLPLNDSRKIEAVFRLNPIDGMSDSKATYNPPAPKTRTNFQLEFANSQLENKYIGNFISLNTSQVGFPQLFGMP